MKTCVPGPDISPSRKRQCSWWTGPRLFILIDDYDLIGTGPMTEPFAPLPDHLALGSKVRVHLMIARSASRASSGVNDSLLRRMMEVSTPGLLSPCPPSEGVRLRQRQGAAAHSGARRPRRATQVHAGADDARGLAGGQRVSVHPSVPMIGGAGQRSRTGRPTPSVAAGAPGPCPAARHHDDRRSHQHHQGEGASRDHQSPVPRALRHRLRQLDGLGAAAGHRPGGR